MLAGRVAAAPEVRWQDSLESLDGWTATQNTTISLADASLESVEGKAAMKIVCRRDPGMTEDGWNGWYRVYRALPSVAVEPGDELRLHHRFDRFEPFYPALYVIIIDDDGTRVRYTRGGRKDTGKWLDAAIPLKSGKGWESGKEPGLQRLVHIEFAYSYNWFRQWGDYTRWVDGMVIGAPLEDASAEAQVAAQPAGRREPASGPTEPFVKPGEAQWPVVFVPHRPKLGNGASIALWREHGGAGALQGRRVHGGEAADDPSDIAANIRLAWNAGGLHVFSEVNDDRVEINSLTKQDFADNDSLRMNFDNRRNALATGNSFDEDDYTFAFIPDSPLGKPMASYANWFGYRHLVNDEDRVFDVGTIKVDGEVRKDGYTLAAMLPTSLMRGFEARENHILTFSAVWADVDGSGRESETMYPRVDARDYWRNLEYNADAVLLGEQGGFTYRVHEQMVPRGQPWAAGLAAVCFDAKAPLTFDVKWEILDSHGQVVATYHTPVEVGREPTWYAIDLPTASLDGGQYAVRPTMSHGNVTWAADPWPVELQGRAPEEWLAAIEASRADVKRRGQALAKAIRELRKQGREVAYLQSVGATVRIFNNILGYHLRKGDLVRAERQLGELAVMLDEAESMAGRLAKGEMDWLAIPREHRAGGEITWRDGAFWKNGRPVVLHGPMGRPVHNFHTRDIALLGFNGVSTDVPLWTVMKNLTEPAPNEERLDEARQLSQTADQAGLHIIQVLPGLHQIGRSNRDDPRLGEASGHCLPFDITLPYVIEVADAFYREVYAFFEKEMPQTLSYCLLNEPAFEISLAGKGDRMFRAWLSEEYGTIAAVNHRWGTTYPSFADIPITRDHASTGARYDWVRFNDTILPGFMEKLIAKSKEIDPTRAVHLKILSPVFRGFASGVYGGNDQYAMAQLQDWNGFDGGNQANFIELWRSLAPDKPMINSESKFPWRDAGLTSRDFWLSAAIGVDSHTLWLWDPPWGGWGRMENYMLQQPAGLHAGAKATLDIQRLMPEVHAISRTEPQVRLLYSKPSKVVDFDAFTPATVAAYDVASRAGVTLGYWTEAQVQERNWGDTRLLILGGCVGLDPRTAEGLAAYVSGGGSLLIVGQPPSKDVYGKPLPATLEAAIDGAPTLGLAKPGENRPFGVSDMIQAMHKAGVDMPLTFTDEQGIVSDAAFARWVERADDTLVFVCTPQGDADPAVVKAMWKGKLIRGLEMIRHERVDGELTVVPGREYLIRLDPPAGTPHAADDD